MKRKPIIHPITCGITRGIMDSRFGDDTPSVPAYVSGVVTDAEPSQVTVTFSAAVTSADYTGGVVIDINGTPVTGLASATVSPSSTIVFTFNEEVVNGDTVTFSYTEASGDYAGDAGDVEDITDAAVINNTFEVPDAFTVGQWDATSGNTQIDVTINSLPSNNGSTITDIEYRLDAGSWVSTGSIVDFSITGLTNGTAYDVQIRAVNAAGGGAASDTKARTPSTLPSAFVDGNWALNDAASGGTLNIVISALPDDGGSALTDIEYRVDGGSWVSVGAATTGTYQITGLTDGVSYDVELRAENAIGFSAASDTKSRTPSAAVAATLTDTFVRGVYGSLDGSTSSDGNGVWTCGTAAKFITQSPGVVASNTSTAQHVAVSDFGVSDDVEVTMYFDERSGAAFGPIARVSSTSATNTSGSYYMCSTFNNDIYLYKVINGSATVLGQISPTIPLSPFSLTLRCEGSTISVTWSGGAETISVTNTDITGNNLVGMRGYSGNSGISSTQIEAVAI